MQIEDKKVVQFHYSLSDDQGNAVESSREGEPMAYLHGSRSIIPGLEKAMVGKSEGDTFNATIPPEEAYGIRQEGSQQRVPIKHLQGGKKWKPGMMAHVKTDQGMRQVSIVKVGKFMADVDTNHPLAGKTLTFEVEVVAVREATSEEISHGHAHGVGGHHH